MSLHVALEKAWHLTFFVLDILCSGHFWTIHQQSFCPLTIESPAITTISFLFDLGSSSCRAVGPPSLLLVGLVLFFHLDLGLILSVILADDLLWWFGADVF